LMSLPLCHCLFTVNFIEFCNKCLLVHSSILTKHASLDMVDIVTDIFQTIYDSDYL